MITQARNYASLQLLMKRNNLKSMGYKLIAETQPKNVNKLMESRSYKSFFVFINYNGVVELWIK